jgi:hypothetical protein
MIDLTPNSSDVAPPIAPVTNLGIGSLKGNGGFEAEADQIELPWLVAEAIESWGRSIGKGAPENKRAILNAADELIPIANQCSGRVRQRIVDNLKICRSV